MRTMIMPVFGFNPTLVRLRLLLQNGIPPKRICFNPTLVRLRRFSRVLIFTPNNGFNPTLVRLRHVSGRGEDIL